MYALPYIAARPAASRRDRRAPPRPHVAIPRVVGASRACRGGAAVDRRADHRVRAVRVGWWPLAIAMIALFVVPALARRDRAPRARAARRGTASRTGPAGCADRRDSDAYGLVCAAWAHAARPTPDGEAWLAARRDAPARSAMPRSSRPRCSPPRRGDAETARELLRSVELSSRTTPRCASSRASGSRAMPPSAARGASSPPSPRDAGRPPRSSYFLEGIALRRTGAPGAPARSSCTRAGCSRRTAARRARCSPRVARAEHRRTRIASAGERAPPGTDRAPLPRAIARTSRSDRPRAPTPPARARPSARGTARSAIRRPARGSRGARSSSTHRSARSIAR